ncbi:MAG: cytochrome c [Desulfobulbaceae bacterium]
MQRLVMGVMLVFLAGMPAANAHAAPCSDCHTMHNSADGLPMRFDSGSSPLPLLLRGDCIDCHTGLNTAANLIPPKVYSTVAPTYIWGNTSGGANTTLAGGSFYYVNTSDAYGHNVAENPVAGPDGTHNNTPPGGAALTGQLQCAGTNGCHGDAAVDPAPLNSLDSAHHTNATGASIDGSTVAKSYRFLNGVLGWEDDDWEFTSSEIDHNRYVGQDRTLVPQVSSTTISGFCARCHGYFHNTTTGSGTAGIGYSGTFSSPWLRHPTDYDMADLVGTEYDAYNTYDTRVPVARTTATLSTGTNAQVGNDQGIITCVTCHRAHGSPYYAALRWNYRAWPGADPLTSTVQAGCQICHTSKN